MPIQTTMIVATMKNDTGWANQECPGFENAQFTSPYCVSKIHCQTTVEVSAGIDHARISDVETSRRIFFPSACSRSAISTPSTIVPTTLTAQKISVRHRTVQK